MNNRYLYRAKKKNWRELPKYKWWVEGYYVELPVGSIAATIVANDEEVVCEDVESYIISIYTKQHSNFSPGFPLEVVECEQYEIDFDTVCQCTGLKDKNGKLIWENDIVKFEDCGEEGYEYKEGFDFENKARVEFTEGRWSLTDFLSDNSAVIDGMYDHEEFMDLWGECEVIGNMIDNPELLEV